MCAKQIFNPCHQRVNLHARLQPVPRADQPASSAASGGGPSAVGASLSPRLASTQFDFAMQLKPRPKQDSTEEESPSLGPIGAAVRWLRSKGANGGVVPNGVVLGLSMLQLLLWCVRRRRRSGHEYNLHLR